MLSIANRIGISSLINRGVSVFKIAHSFLLDGTNEQFEIDNANLSSVLQGSVEKSITFNFYPITGQGDYLLWSNGNTDRGIHIFWFASYISIAYYRASDGAARYARFSASAFTLDDWNFATFTINTVNGVGLLKVNGSEIPSTVENISASDNVISNTDDFIIGGGGTAGFSNLNGYFNYISIDDILTLSQHQELYNLGEPLNPTTVDGITNCMFINADDSNDTAQFTITDSVNSINSVSVNLETADKTTFTPYVIAIGQMVIGTSFLIG